MCGIFGIYNHKDAARLTYLGLYALQHRGQESAGIVVSDTEHVTSHKGMGLVADVFSKGALNKLKGKIAIGHVRYSTTGSSDIKNAQPFLVKYSHGTLAIGHNGNLVNAKVMKDRLEKEGAIFQTTIDSEVIVHLIARSKKNNFVETIVDGLSQVKGAYSLVFLTEDKIVAARDPNGFRPLCLGKLDGVYVVASETCAFDLIQAKYIRDVEPGEILIIDQSGLKSIKPFPKANPSFCIFEFIYFARPDSRVFGKNVYVARKNMGEQLAKESPAKSAELVVPIPDSGICAGLGFAKKSKMPFEMAIIRNHYVGRTFIQPSQYVRDLGVKVKLNPVREIIKNKKIVVIEDSIVRGTTSRARIRTLKDAGVSQVHMRVSCPAHKFPCVYGIDFPNQKELIAFKKDIKKIRNFIGLDSLGYLSLEGLYKSVGIPKEKFCVACFTGRYPVKFDQGVNKSILER